MHDLNDIEGHRPSCRMRLSLRKPNKLLSSHLHRLSLLASDAWIHQIQADQRNLNRRCIIRFAHAAAVANLWGSSSLRVSCFLVLERPLGKYSTCLLGASRRCRQICSGTDVFTGEFISLQPALRRSEAFLVLFLFKVQRVAGRLLSKLQRHFHTPCQCLLIWKDELCSVCSHSEVADVLMQDYGGWTYADFLTRLQDEIWACDAVYERMINCGLICILNKIVCVWLKFTAAIKCTY